MIQTQKLLQAVKKALRHKGYTYLDVAEHLSLSEASIKRMFAHNHISLQRLEKIGELMGMDFEALLEAMHRDQEYIQELSRAQEQELVEDKRLLLVAISVLNRMTYSDMQTHINLSTTQLTFYLQKLETLGLIALLPEYQIRLLIAHNFHWRPTGPIQNYFKERIAAEFFDTDFQQDDEKMKVINAALSTESNRVLQNHIDRLIQLFVDLEKKDATLPFHEKEGITLLAAIRPWDLEVFQPYRKETSQ